MASKLFRLVATARHASALHRIHQRHLPRPLPFRFFSVQELVKKPVEASGSQSLDELLASVKNKTTDVKEIVGVMNSLQSLITNKQIDVSHIQNNVEFQTICTKLGKKSGGLSNSTLVSVLKSLLVMGLQTNNYVVKSLETEVLWRLRKMNMKTLSFLLNFHTDFQKDDLQQQVVGETIQQIQLRWVEVSDIQDVSSLLIQHEKFNREFIAKLEDRAVEVVEKATAEDLARLFVLLANLKQRSIPLLRSMAFHLSKHQEKLSVKHMTNVLYAMNTLTFPDQLLLQRITTDLQCDLSGVENSSIVAAALTALGQLKWKDPKLLEAFSEWFQKNLDRCRTQDFVAYLLTSAGQNYIDQEVDAIFTRILSKVTQNSVGNPSVWLDVVWSLVVLKRANADHLTSVLKEDFHQKMQTVPSKLKLQNINASAKYEYPDYKGPFIPSEYFESLWPPRSKQAEKLRSSVCEALSNFLPKGKFLITNKATPLGIGLDAEFVVDASAKPMPLTAISIPFGSGTVVKPVPIGLHRVGVLVWDYKDYNLNTGDLTGVNALAVRLLNKLNYTVIQIPYTEYHGIKTTVKKVQYLQKKVADTVVQYNQLSKKTSKT